MKFARENAEVGDKDKGKEVVRPHTNTSKPADRPKKSKGKEVVRRQEETDEAEEEDSGTYALACEAM